MIKDECSLNCRVDDPKCFLLEPVKKCWIFLAHAVHLFSCCRCTHTCARPVFIDSVLHSMVFWHRLPNFSKTVWIIRAVISNSYSSNLLF